MESNKNYVIKLRREFHKYPELSWQEYRTSKRIKEELEKISIKYVEVAKTGVIGIIEGQNNGKVVALRADMDALPIKEENEVEYKSENNGVMHACGHDGHTAMLLGAAKLLKEKTTEFNGKILLIFQPAEETIEGAKKVIEESDILKEVDSFFGIHLWLNLDYGKISIRPGPALAAADKFEIKIKGYSTHGSLPHLGIDPTVAAVSLINNLQSISSREINPLEPIVVSIGYLKVGDGFNIISDTALIKGTTRCFNLNIRKKLPEIIERISVNTAKAFRCEANVKFIEGTPPTINDKNCVKIAEKAVENFLGRKSICHINKTTGGEDFAYYIQEVPGAFAFVGAKNKDKGIIYPHHNSKFDIDEDSLEIGTNLYVNYALEYLK